MPSCIAQIKWLASVAWTMLKASKNHQKLIFE